MSLQPIFAPTDATRPSITVHPQKEESTASQPSWKGSFQKATLGDVDGRAWGGDGFGADDFVDLINPLQHIPVIGHIYRELTGDTASAETKVIGGAVFGGPVGLIASAVSAIIEQESGQSVAQTALSLFNDSETPVAAQQPTNAKQQIAALQAQPVVSPATLADLLPDEEEATIAEDDYSAAPQLPDLSDEEQQKHQLILELFGDKLANLNQQINEEDYSGYAQQAVASFG